MPITKRVVTRIERVEIIAMSDDKQRILDELANDGYDIKSIGPYTNAKLFPKVDPTRFKLTAEREVDRGASGADYGKSLGGPKLLPVGTRIRFIKTMTGEADEDGPARLYATKGEYGTITGHGTKEGYWVKRDCWPAAFGASHGTEFIAVDDQYPAGKDEA